MLTAADSGVSVPCRCFCSSECDESGSILRYDFEAFCSQ
jgi:hypothetical protein